MHHALLVLQRNPCTACVILNSLDRESLQKVADSRSDLVWETVEIGHPSEARFIPGLEVESYPAVLLDGEQITAGSILSPRLLERYLGKETT